MEAETRREQRPRRVPLALDAAVVVLGAGAGLLALSLVLAGCGRAPRATVLYVTDAHEIAPVVDRHGDRGGVARLKSVVDARRAADPDALLVFGGDLAGGTLFGGVFRGEPMVDALGRAGVGLATFGQHDLDFGAAHARALVERSAFPWVSSNLVGRDGKPFASLPARTVVRVGGLSVGFLGLTDDLGTTTQEGSVFQEDLVAAAARETDVLRREGAEAVVALTQAGFDANRRLLLEVPGIDAVLTEEESETLSVVRWVGGRPVVAPCGNLGSLAELVLERRERRVAASVAAYPIDASVAPDPGLVREEAKWTAILNERLAAPAGALAEPLDETGSRERETALGSLVADAFRAAAGAQVGLVSGSSLRASLPSGPLTRRNAMSVLPFGNRVVVVEMTGSALRAALERGLASVGRRTGSLLQVSGLAVVADLAAPDGKRLIEVRVAGDPLGGDAVYRVAVSSHLASGGDGHAEIAAGRRVASGAGEPLDVDALAAHLSRLAAAAPATPPAHGRIVLGDRGSARR